MQALGSSSLFTSRAFLPAFLTALSLRYGELIPYIQDIHFIENAAASPTWFTHGGVVSLLGALAAFEFVATKNADARQLYDQFDAYAKTGMAALTSAGLLSVSDTDFIRENIQEAGFTDMVLPLIVAGPVFFFATIRSQTLGFLAEADADDELGIQKLLAWLEDAYVTFGFLALLIFPLIMLPLLGLALLGLFLVQRYLQKRELATQIPCPSCEEMIFPIATRCPHCAASIESPTAVGALGQPKTTPSDDPANQAYRLTSKKRCPRCATRLPERSPQQNCPACDHRLNDDPAFVEAYVDYVSQRLPHTLLITGLLSLIPVLGLIPGVIYYRLTLIAPFRAYLPFSKRFFLKIAIGLFFLCLISIQWVPVAGGIVLPLMAFTNFVTHRAAFRSMVSQQPA